MATIDDIRGAVQAQIQESEIKAVCQSRALFLADTPVGILFLLLFFAFPVAASLNVWMTAYANPKVAQRLETVPVSAAERPQTHDTSTPLTPPPAYGQHETPRSEQPVANTEGEEEFTGDNHPSTYSDVRWSTSPAQDSTYADASTFVEGTFLFGFLLFLHVLLAATIQAMAYCWRGPFALMIVLWVIYGGLCLLSLRGLGAWMVLIRNLWGKRGRERVVFQDDVLIAWALMLLSTPYTVPVFLVVQCQKYCCGASLDKVDQDIELGVTPSSARFPTTDNLPREVEHSSKEQVSKEEVELEEPNLSTAETQGLLAGQEQSSSVR